MSKINNNLLKLYFKKFRFKLFFFTIFIVIILTTFLSLYVTFDSYKLVAWKLVDPYIYIYSAPLINNNLLVGILWFIPLFTISYFIGNYLEEESNFKYEYIIPKLNYFRLNLIISKILFIFIIIFLFTILSFSINFIIFLILDFQNKYLINYSNFNEILVSFFLVYLSLISIFLLQLIIITVTKKKILSVIFISILFFLIWLNPEFSEFLPGSTIILNNYKIFNQQNSSFLVLESLILNLIIIIGSIFITSIYIKNTDFIYEED